MTGMCRIEIRNNVSGQNFQFLPQGSLVWGQRVKLGMAVETLNEGAGWSYLQGRCVQSRKIFDTPVKGHWVKVTRSK